MLIVVSAVNPNSKSSGTWDSIHVFESAERARTAHYKLTSTVILNLGTESESLGGMDLSGNMTRQVEQDLPIDGDESHVANLGRMVEDMELKMRNLLRTCLATFYRVCVALTQVITEEVYFGKARDVVGDLRSKALLSMDCIHTNVLRQVYPHYQRRIEIEQRIGR